MASVLRVFIEAASVDARQRLVAEATRAGWRVVARREDADAVLGDAAGPAEPGPGAVSNADDDEPRESLTPREQDVMALLSEGAGNREIAERLGMSEHTVKFHLAAIFGKLGATTRTEAVRRALKWGWVDL